MMMNLFSTFDPMASQFNYQLNWISMTLIIMSMVPLYWFNPTKAFLPWIYIINFLYKEFKLLFNSKNNMTLLISMFLFIMINNSLGLFPYIFTATSHISMTMALAMTLWLSLMLQGWFNKTNFMLANLLPKGTPKFLMPFMVIIEIISNITRPITLSIRLAANMIAGHLLLDLLSSSTSMYSLASFFMPILFQIPLFSLEIAVVIIQAYVFTTLITLYASEI